MQVYEIGKGKDAMFLHKRLSCIFSRKKVVGKEVLFTEETTTATRSYGCVYLPPDPSVKDITQCENITKVREIGEFIDRCLL